MNIRLETYNRLIQTSKAETILSRCKIHFNKPHLLILSKYKSELAYRILCLLDENDDISVKYNSRHIVTNRLFTDKGSINLITLSDNDILKSIISRYKSGKVVKLDYVQFELTIIAHLLNIDEMKGDFHSWTSQVLGVDRDTAKKYNMWMLYSTNFKESAKRLIVNLEDCSGEDDILLYLTVMKQIKNSITQWLDENNNLDQKFIVNSYGRKIYPKGKDSIFNNVIQSIGSEILIDAIIAVNEYTNRNHGIGLLFHRFDSLYFDIAEEKLKDHVKNLMHIMESINESIPLKIGVSLGDNLSSLKEIQIE